MGLAIEEFGMQHPGGDPVSAKIASRVAGPVGEGNIRLGGVSKPAIMEHGGSASSLEGEPPSNVVTLGDPEPDISLLEMVACTDLFHFDLMLRDMRSWTMSLGPQLAQGIFDIWDAFGICRFVAMGVTSLAFIHNFVLCMMHMLYRFRMDYYEFSVLQLCNVICLWCTWRLWYWRDLSSDKQGMYLVIIMAGYVVCLVMDFIVNALPGRSSEMALFDATLFCVCSFLCLRGTRYKAVANFSPCFSWHFWKRLLPWLEEERGRNVSHLVYVVFVYGLSLYISSVIEPCVTAKIERRKKEKLAGQRLLDRRRRHPRRCDVACGVWCGFCVAFRVEAGGVPSVVYAAWGVVRCDMSSVIYEGGTD